MFETGWHTGSPRETGFGKALTSGFVTDHDLIAPRHMDRHPFYQELLTPLGLRWFIGIAFEVAGRTWVFSVQGTPERGPFGQRDAEILLGLKDDLTEAASRSAELGFQRQINLESLFDHPGRAAIVIDWNGRLLSSSDEGEQMLGDCGLLRGDCIIDRDPAVAAGLDTLIAAAVRYSPGKSAPMPRPVEVSTPDKRLLWIDALPMQRDFQALGSGACAILTVHELNASAAADDEYRRRFNLTAREAELAVRLAAGNSLSESAGALGMSVGTARHHLKSIFGKTGTRRQAELVALLARTSS